MFLDINLPKCDRRKILTQINYLKKENRPTHIFIISRYADSADAKVKVVGCALYYFNKPIDVNKDLTNGIDLKYKRSGYIKNCNF